MRDLEISNYLCASELHYSSSHDLEIVRIATVVIVNHSGFKLAIASSAEV